VRGDGLLELKRALARLVREAVAAPVLEEHP
jgi:hypothetical protein